MNFPFNNFSGILFKYYMSPNLFSGNKMTRNQKKKTACPDDTKINFTKRRRNCEVWIPVAQTQVPKTDIIINY